MKSEMQSGRLDWPLAAAVLAHLLVSFVHGSAHDGGHVALTRGQSPFVYAVILVGPLAGLALSYVWRSIGALLVAAAMAGALVFGFLNHFVIISPDHVSQVAAEWRPLFTITAYVLMASEAAG